MLLAHVRRSGRPRGAHDLIIAATAASLLDRSFVRHAATDAKDAAIVTSTVQLSRALGMRMVGEDVEDEDVATLLFDAGVDRVQGWHPARAMPATALLDWCTRRQAQLSGVG